MFFKGSKQPNKKSKNKSAKKQQPFNVTQKHQNCRETMFLQNLKAKQETQQKLTDHINSKKQNKQNNNSRTEQPNMKTTWV